MRTRPGRSGAHQLHGARLGLPRPEPPGPSPQSLPDHACHAECPAEADRELRSNARLGRFPQRTSRRHPRSRQPGKSESHVSVRYACDFPGVHSTSFLPLLFSTRAKTNSKSDKRFKYTITCGLTCSVRLNVTTSRSARRQTVRAKWHHAPAAAPPGKTNDFSGCNCSFHLSMA